MPDEVRTARLVRAARRGDEEAFRDLLEEHREAISSTLVACGVRCPETARDLTQDTALRAWLRLGSLRNPRAFSAWIRQIAAHAARDYLRRVVVRRTERIEVASWMASESNPLEDTERRSEIRLMIAALSSEEAGTVEILIERARGVSNRKLADRLGISEDALKMRLMRVRKRLRRRLENLREPN